MKEENSDEVQGNNDSGFNSRDSVIVVIDAPGDPIDPNEPIDPTLLALLTAERDKSAYWTAVRKQQEDSQKSAKPAEPDDANQS
jgi:hypothetical protein